MLRDSFRQSDILARYGGDEFAVLVSDATAGRSDIPVDRIQRNVHVRNAEPGRRYQLSLSIGIVESGAGQALDLGHLLHLADERMYQDKRDRPLVRRGP